MLAIIWSVIVCVSALASQITGVPTVPIALVAGCVVMIWHFLQDSGDMLDLRVGFYLAVLLFIAIPNIVLAAEFGRNGTIWHSQVITRLAVEREDFERVQLLLAVGMASVSAAMLAVGRSSVAVEPEGQMPVGGRTVAVIYVLSLAMAGALTFIQYGSLDHLIQSALDPVARLENAAGSESGLAGILLFIVAISAYYLTRRLTIRALGLPLFLPAIVLVVPLASRGTLVEILLIMALALSDLRVKAPFAVLLCAALLLPPFSGGLVIARNGAFGGAQDYSLGALYRGFGDDSPMVAVWAMTLQSVREGTFSYTYGMDLLMLPLWYMPRSLWPSKPMPLDFRLNAALGLNDGTAYGTPVGLFGGIYLNFTMLAYVPVLIGFGWGVAALYRRVRSDRLVLLLCYVCVVDLVRVGDLSRELVTLSIGLFAIWFVRRFTTTLSNATLVGGEPAAMGPREGDVRPLGLPS